MKTYYQSSPAMFTVNDSFKHALLFSDLTYSKENSIYFRKMSSQRYVWCARQLLAEEKSQVYLIELFLRHNQEMPFPSKGVWVAIVLTGSVTKTCSFFKQNHKKLCVTGVGCEATTTKFVQHPFSQIVNFQHI